MSPSVRIKLIHGYLFLSLLVILIWVALSYGPFWHRDIFDIAQQNIPLKWYEYVENYLSYLLPSALYGLFSLFVVRKIKHGKKSGSGYFIGAIIIGVIMVLVAWADGPLGRIDCNNNCAAYIPSYAASNITALLTIPVLLILPGYLLYVFHKYPNAKSSRK